MYVPMIFLISLVNLHVCPNDISDFMIQSTCPNDISDFMSQSKFMPNDISDFMIQSTCMS